MRIHIVYVTFLLIVLSFSSCQKVTIDDDAKILADKRIALIKAHNEYDEVFKCYTGEMNKLSPDCGQHDSGTLKTEQQKLEAARKKILKCNNDVVSLMNKYSEKYSDTKFKELYQQASVFITSHN